MTDSPPTPTPAVVPIAPDPPAAAPPTIGDLRAALALQQEADLMIAETLETRRSALERVESLMREAERAAARAEKEAATAATQRLAAAREEADRVLGEAQVRAAQITSEAGTEVTALRADAAELRDSAQETLEAAEMELERARGVAAQRERQLLAARIRTMENLERVAAAIDHELEAVRAEVDAAKRNLAQSSGDVGASTGDDASPSVVLQWPHHLAPAQVADPTDTEEAAERSKHRRRDPGGRRGLLRKART